MPLVQSTSGKPPQILTKDRDRVITSTLSTTAAKRLREASWRKLAAQRSEPPQSLELGPTPDELPLASPGPSAALRLRSAPLFKNTSTHRCVPSIYWRARAKSPRRAADHERNKKCGDPHCCLGLRNHAAPIVHRWRDFSGLDKPTAELFTFHANVILVGTLAKGRRAQLDLKKWRRTFPAVAAGRELLSGNSYRWARPGRLRIRRSTSG
jgi:hypothetical protein